VRSYRGWLLDYFLRLFFLKSKYGFRLRSDRESNQNMCPGLIMGGVPAKPRINTRRQTIESLMYVMPISKQLPAEETGEQPIWKKYFIPKQFRDSHKKKWKTLKSRCLEGTIQKWKMVGFKHHKLLLQKSQFLTWQFVTLK
jgi:hypothetical protein